MKNILKIVALFCLMAMMLLLIVSCGNTSIKVEISTGENSSADVTTPEESTPEPEVTTLKPEVTTPELEVTTPEPEVTTPELEVTTPEPEVTTPEREVTTPEPEVTTPE
ncbi:MAG: hypothetical protein IJV73_03610, partial [Clostridia bacterium]|nr:hypothetical protein [Clostridia bacterium]